MSKKKISEQLEEIAKGCIGPPPRRSPKTIDWEQRRYELVKSAISGCADGSLRTEYRELTVMSALNLADALIEELKKKDNDKQD